MILDRLFHVYYKKSPKTSVYAHSLTVEEVEEKVKSNEINFSEHEILPLDVDMESTIDGSY